jgi:hypothetical protein
MWVSTSVYQEILEVSPASARSARYIVEMRWLVVAVVCAGCYAPHPQAGSPCMTGVCPEGLVCSPATATCEVTAVPVPHDAAPDGTPVVDGRLGDAAPPLPDATPVDAAPTVPVLVQQITAHIDTGATVSAALPNPTQAGDVLMMIGGNPQGGLISVTGGGVASWTRLARSTANVNIEIWIGVTAGSSDSVVIALPGANAPNTLWLGEWSGLTTTLDGMATGNGTTSPAHTPTLGLANARELVVFAVADGQGNAFGTPAPGAWTAAMPVNSTFVNQAEWYAIVNGGAVGPAVSETASNWDAALVALRIAP